MDRILRHRKRRRAGSVFIPSTDRPLNSRVGFVKLRAARTGSSQPRAANASGLPVAARRIGSCQECGGPAVVSAPPPMPRAGVAQVAERQPFKLNAQVMPGVRRIELTPVSIEGLSVTR